MNDPSLLRLATIAAEYKDDNVIAFRMTFSKVDIGDVLKIRHYKAVARCPGSHVWPPCS